MITPMQNQHLVLATKLSVPPSPVNLVYRQRLIEKMTRALHCRVTTVVAPPGFGKSIFVSDWLRHAPVPLRAGWVSLDPGENDLHRFWSYVISSLEKQCPGIGQKALSLLQSMMATSIEHIITLFINDLYVINEHVVLVLDDYHLIESEEVHRSLLFFLDKKPEKTILCIVSRSSPPLPLGAIRAKGQLNEIGINDLKFNEEEIAAFWLQQMNTSLTEQQLKRLAELTEGWIAGIQLASISGAQDLGQMLDQFSGNHRYVVDYLMEDVINHLPETMRRFLFQSSILERMNADLCAAVTGSDEDKEVLVRAQQANLFLIPLDNEGRWYRYHHLFLEFLRNRSYQEIGGELHLLHQRAGKWLKDHGYIEEAIEHSLKAGNYEEAAEWIEGHAVNMFKKREMTTLNRWFKEMPPSISKRPSFLIIQIYAEMLLGQFIKTSELIGQLAIAVDELQSDPLSIESQRMREELYICLSFHAWIQRDYETIYNRINEVYERDAVPGAEVVQLLLKDVIHLHDGSFPLIGGFSGFDGKLRKAKSFHQLYERFIAKHHLEEWHYVAFPYASLSEIYYEENELDLAMKYASAAISSAEKHNSIGAYLPAVMVMARIYRAWGRPQMEKEIISSAMGKLVQEGGRLSHWHDLLAAYLAGYDLETGALDKAEAWLMRSNISKEVSAAVHQQFEITVRIRILIAKGSYAEALDWAERMVDSARLNGRHMMLLNSYLLLTVIQSGMNDMDAAMQYLHSALSLGEEEGYCRTFVDMGAGLHDLLVKYAAIRKSKAVPELLAGVSNGYVSSLITLVQPVSALSAAEAETNDDQSSMYGLTAREIEVLRAVCDGLSNKEIAEQLVLTVGTVKLHLNRIYSKLDVKGRVQAVRKAKELHISL